MSQHKHPYMKRAYESASALGASGSVMGILVFFGALFPSEIIYVNFIIPVPV